MLNPEAQVLEPDQYEVIGEKASYRLAQRPGSYVVLKYVRPVIKRHDTQTLHCPPARSGVIEGSRRRKLSGENKRLHRLTHSKPLVEEFFDWVDRQFEQQGLLPSNPLTKALAYVRDRRAGLEVFLSDPDVPMDTNHVERALRVIPMGKRNWLFCGPRSAPNMPASCRA